MEELKLVLNNQKYILLSKLHHFIILVSVILTKKSK